MKGVLALDVGSGKVEQLVYQGVHMNYSGELMGLIKQARLQLRSFASCYGCARSHLIVPKGRPFWRLTIVPVVWPQGQPLSNRLVFIGKYLDGEQLERDFMACRA